MSANASNEVDPISKPDKSDARFVQESLAAMHAVEIDGDQPSVSWETLIDADASGQADVEGAAAAESPTMADDRPTIDDPVRSDSLAASVILLMVLSCIQPLVTFLRGIVFCRWLEADQLGVWDMALSFLTLAAPVVVFGIPGSFGRYVQHYLKRGQLSSFLRRTSAVCLVLSIAAVAAVSLAPNTFARVVFGEAAYARLIPAIVVCLAAMIGFGFVIELLTALRLFRIASLLQFVKGFSFLLFGALLLWVWQAGPESVIVAYALACGTVVLAGGWSAWNEFRRLPAEHAPPTHRSLWAKLMPFAVWIWVTNLLDNLYMVVDRYMILHYSGLPNLEALGQVGNYHSSRIVPLLFVSFAGMLASLILPHMSHDWESGRRHRVGDQVVLSIKLVALALTSGSMCVLFAAPWLFEIGFRGKYDGGLAVLPWTLVFCAWIGVTYIAEMYILCAERVKVIGLAMLCGLAINVVLNLILLPPLGLLGAVLATALSRLIVLLVIYCFALRLGMPFRWSMWLLTLAPLAVVLGPWLGSLLLAGLLAGVVGTNRLITLREKATLLRATRQARQTVCRKLGWT